MIIASGLPYGIVNSGHSCTLDPISQDAFFLLLFLLSFPFSFTSEGLVICLSNIYLEEQAFFYFFRLASEFKGVRL